MNGEGCQAKGPRTIQSDMDAMGKLSANLGDAIDRLAERLSDVMRPAEPAADQQNVKRDEGLSSGLGRRLVESELQMTEHLGKLADIAQRLEL